MSKKKLITGTIILAATIILTGCGKQDASTQKKSEDNQMKNEQMMQDDSSPKMPEANGNVDDTVDAIIDGANSEDAQATSTDSDAAAAVGDGTDTNNLNSTYDQNSL